MKYIIMCGGEYHEEQPRWLRSIRGEAIAERTIRLLKENGIEDIAVSSLDPRLEALGVPRLEHNNRYVCGDTSTCWLDAFYPMVEPVCYLYGDVYYSEYAIETIVKYRTDDIMYFASAYPYADGYVKHWEEPFAFKVEDTHFFRRAVEITKEYNARGMFNRDAISWELWQVIKGTPLNVVEQNYFVINDYTCDIDTDEEAQRLEEFLK